VFNWLWLALAYQMLGKNRRGTPVPRVRPTDGWISKSALDTVAMRMHRQNKLEAYMLRQEVEMGVEGYSPAPSKTGEQFSRPHSEFISYGVNQGPTVESEQKAGLCWVAGCCIFWDYQTVAWRNRNNT
jgi:hypothetical protein